MHVDTDGLIMIVWYIVISNKGENRLRKTLNVCCIGIMINYNNRLDILMVVVLQ